MSAPCFCRRLLPQIAKMVCKGGRPKVPGRGGAPSPAGGEFPGWPAYVTLMEACWAQDPQVSEGWDCQSKGFCWHRCNLEQQVERGCCDIERNA